MRTKRPRPDSDPIILDYAEEALLRAERITERIAVSIEQFARWSKLDAKKQKDKHRSRSANLRFDDHADRLKELPKDIGAALAILDDEDDFKERELDTIFGLIFCSLDEIGVDLKEYMTTAPGRNREKQALDREAPKLVSELYETYDAIVRTRDALFSKGRRAADEIYQIRGASLNQTPAPHHFQVDAGVIDSQSPEAADLNQINLEALSVLAQQAADLSLALRNSNTDPRLHSLIARYTEALTPKSFSSIRLELVANNVRGLVQSLKDELSASAVVSATALLLSHDQVMRQFPEWRRFVEEGPIPVSSKEELDASNDAILRLVASPGIEFALSVTSRAQAAASEAKEGYGDLGNRGRSTDAVVRSVMNLIKANVSYLMKQIKDGRIEVNSVLQKLHFSFFIKLLPHFKLFASYVPVLSWLVPMLDYIQDLSAKGTKKPQKRKRSS